MPSDEPPAASPVAPSPDRTSVPWVAFGATSAAYMAVTVGESILAPLYPAAAGDLGLGLGDAGAALGLLTGSIAVANVAGGFLLARCGPKAGIVAALTLAAAGAAVAATAPGVWPFLAGQVLLGLAAGTFFASGIQTVGTLGGASRRGMVMGVFGVAFSAGLTLAALLGAAGAVLGWRAAFAATGVFAALAALGVAVADLPPAPRAPRGGARRPLRDALGLAAGVGSLAAATQYGTVVFLPVFAVSVWDVEPGAAALLLAAGRTLSVPAKAVAGHLSDRIGPLATTGHLGIALAASGVAWVVAPDGRWGAVPAVAFVAAVSAVFPIANVLAFGELGDRGPLLGAFRSVQMGAGAAAAAAIGTGAHALGLRPALLASLIAPVLLVVLSRRAGAALGAG